MPILRVEEQDIYYKWSPAKTETKEGVIFVLIHGLGSSHSFYETVVPYLVEKRHSCLSIDTPGSGLSNYTYQDRTPTQLASLFSRFFVELKLDHGRLIPVGHSMGAMIACELALQVQVKAVVLLGPVHPSAALHDIFEARISTIQKGGLEVLADSIPTAATGSGSTATQRAFIRSLILSQSPEGYISLCRTISNATPPKYDHITSPLLIIAGSEDKTSPLPGCQTILDSWGRKDDTGLKLLEGVGHWHCIEDANGVGQLLDRLVRSQE